MRLIEINRNFEDILNNNRILLEIEKFYGGNIIRIKNFNSLKTVLKVLESASLNVGNINAIDAIFENHLLEEKNYIDIPVNEYNQINNHINSISPQAVQYHNFITALMEVQGLKSEQLPQIINIKLPQNIDSFKSLNEFNSRLDKNLKRFSIDGSIKFHGFDKGSEWYEILFYGAGISYYIFIGCLNIAQKIITLRKTYYESGDAKIHYQTALNAMGSDKKLTKKDIELYIDNRVEEELKLEIGNLLKNLDIKTITQTKKQLINQVTLATKELVKEISEVGTEFHLSLNPPDFVEEIEGKLDIDYTKIVLQDLDSEQKELPSGEE